MSIKWIFTRVDNSYHVAPSLRHDNYDIISPHVQGSTVNLTFELFLNRATRIFENIANFDKFMSCKEFI